METTNSAAAAFAGGGSPSPAPAGGAPSPTPSPSAAPAPSPAPAGGAEWYSSIADEPTRTWVAAKGWKDASGLAESAYNLEKLIGHEKAGRTVVIPGEQSTAEEISAYRAKIGIPQNATDYQLPVPEGQSGEFATQASQWFHEIGIPPKQAQQLAAKWNEFAATSATAQDQNWATQADQDFTRVIGGWGQEADANLEAGRRAAAQFIPAGNAEERGAIMNKIERAIGTETMLKMFASIGKGIGEHRAAGMDSGGGSFGLSQEAAQQRISELKGNKAWTAAYLGGGAGEKAEFEKLMKIAYPDPSA